MTDAGGLGVGAQGVGLRVGGRPPGGWRNHHASGHPDVVGTFTDDCPFCRHDQRRAEVREAEVALDGATRKAEKQRAFLADTEDAVEQYHYELGQARERAAAAEKASRAEVEREVGGDGVVG